MKEILQDFSNIIVESERYLKYIDLPSTNKSHVTMIQMAGEYYEMMKSEREMAEQNSSRGILLEQLMDYMLRFQALIENHAKEEIYELIAEMKENYEIYSIKQTQTELMCDIIQTDLQSMNLEKKKLQVCQELVEFEQKHFGGISDTTEKIMKAYHMKLENGIVIEEIQELINAQDKLYHITDLDSFTDIHEARIMSLISENGKDTMVINAYGGPGAGKTTSCLSLVAELKKRGYTVEYVSEYAKELVYDDLTMLDGSKENQLKILGEQIKRMDRYMGKIDFIVTDASILLNPVYLKDDVPGYDSSIAKIYNHYKNFNFFVNRGEKFVQEGRVENLDESIRKDQEIKEILKKNQIFYGTYTHETVENLADKVLITHGKITPAKERPKTFKAIAYMKEKTDNPLILYGNNAEELIKKLQFYNQDRENGKEFITCYLRMYQPESGSYENNRKFDLATGKDITPIYLNIPHMKKDQFLEVVKQIKKDGAKYNPIKKSFYITKENDLNKFSEYLPLPGTFGQDREGRPRRELQVDIEKNSIQNTLQIKVEGMEPFQVSGKDYNADFSKMTSAEVRKFANQYILPQHKASIPSKNTQEPHIEPLEDKGERKSIIDKIKANQGKIEEYSGTEIRETQRECR